MNEQYVLVWEFRRGRGVTIPSWN